MQCPDDAAANQAKNRPDPLNRFEGPCREILAMYNILIREEQEKIPSSLIRAICIYAGVESAEEIKAEEYPAGIMTRLTISLLELLLFFSGAERRQDAITRIRELTPVRDRKIVQGILTMKEQLEEEAQPADGGQDSN